MHYFRETTGTTSFWMLLRNRMPCHTRSQSIPRLKKDIVQRTSFPDYYLLGQWAQPPLAPLKRNYSPEHNFVDTCTLSTTQKLFSWPLQKTPSARFEHVISAQYIMMLIHRKSFLRHSLPANKLRHPPIIQQPPQPHPHSKRPDVILMPPYGRPPKITSFNTLMIQRPFRGNLQTTFHTKPSQSL